MNDTIAAISTTMGVGAISIIRVSGKKSIPIVNKLFKGKDFKKVDTHNINYGHITVSNTHLRA
ncbi:MAG: tRNA uridine-5-carboxymethylaminomethyl(34) synthesis GTPase MnmE, partial [Bacilli bacterium]|nr:tRNA uridine-5-carboxymethylaminomethyl(34) synthesis GTPase MnmE [Bacilli bacterium]